MSDNHQKKRKFEWFNIEEARESPYDIITAHPEVIHAMTKLSLEHNFLVLPELYSSLDNFRRRVELEKQKMTNDSTLVGSVSFLSSKTVWKWTNHYPRVLKTNMEIVVQTREKILQPKEAQISKEDEKRMRQDSDELTKKVYEVMLTESKNLGFRLKDPKNDSSWLRIFVTNGYVFAKSAISDDDLEDQEGNKRLKKKQKRDNE